MSAQLSRLILQLRQTDTREGYHASDGQLQRHQWRIRLRRLLEQRCHWLQLDIVEYGSAESEAGHVSQDGLPVKVGAGDDQHVSQQHGLDYDRAGKPRHVEYADGKSAARGRLHQHHQRRRLPSSTSALPKQPDSHEAGNPDKGGRADYSA